MAHRRFNMVWSKQSKSRVKTPMNILVAESRERIRPTSAQTQPHHNRVQDLVATSSASRPILPPETFFFCKKKRTTGKQIKWETILRLDAIVTTESGKHATAPYCCLVLLLSCYRTTTSPTGQRCVRIVSLRVLNM